jgi:transposase
LPGARLKAFDLLVWDDFGMAKRYRPVLRDQPVLLPEDMRGWLPEDHPVWLVIGAVEGPLDTSAFHQGRRTGGAGTAGYDPDLLVALLMWAYANGVTSSRRIEQLCRTDVAFRVIGGGNFPDHVTIARFRAAFGSAVESLFTEVLVLCARLGMGRLGTVALDGMKIAANASKAVNRTERALRKLAAERVAAHEATDQAEDELFGEGRRGDEVPPEAASPATRDERIRRALAELEAERKAAEAERDAQARAYLEALESGPPPAGPPPAAAAVAAAAARLERAEAEQRAKLAAWEAQRAAEKEAGIPRPPGGRKPFGPEAHAGVAKARAALERAKARAVARERKTAARKGPGPVRNITDVDSRLMPIRGGGFLQGYNAQNVTSQDTLIIATELTQDTTDTAWFEPMLRQAEAAAALVTACHLPSPPGRHGTSSGSDGDIGLFLADAGYCSEHNLTIAGPDRLIATGKHRDLEQAARDGTAQPAGGEATAAMAARLATPEGITAYRQRGHIAETPHGHLKHNMRFRQLSVRGKPRAAAEWRFACTVHNLFKAITTGHLTTQALAALAA